MAALTKLIKYRSIKFLLLVLLWSVLGIFFVMQQYIYSASTDNPFNWFNNLTYRVPTYLLWAFFTPIIYKIVNSLRFKKEFIIKSILILSISGIVISFVHRFLSIFATFFIRDLYGTLNVELTQALLNARFAIIGGSFDSVFTYLLILAVVLGLVYYKRLRETERLSSQLETKLAEAKLDSLKSQLHPHFLFNTLHAISTLMHRDVEMAEKTLTRLSDLLRLSIGHLDQQKITLKEELEFLEKYLEIQKVRFQDKLNVNFNIGAELYDVVVPSFLLQPVVENSIKYAVEPSSENESIIISAEQNETKLALVVEDSGPGLSETFREGVGIKNTRSRLQHIYGDSFELTFENRASSGLAVQIKIPLER